ncbi:UNVERIFIED_CONTAM: Transcription factor DUO1 [Sesamum indicum]
MEGKRRMVLYDEVGEIKKGPWKAEEDEVLINHVKKYGPRDWSSIRSKGLLHRTGKSCRLRWVNKLRPDLKTGVKFSAEEERTVIDLQAQFGNKWARIATYLPGRTDNDVKNFWSSRQKRLARILQTSSASSSTNSHKSTVQVQAPAFLDISPVEAPKFSSSTDEESVAKSQTCSSSHIDDNDTIKMVLFQDLVYPSTLTHEQNTLQLDYNTSQKKQFPEQESHLSFPQIPQLQPDFSLALESQDFVNRLGDPNFLDEFEPPCFVPDRSCQIPGRAESNDTVDLDTFISDFPPIDLFDDIEPLPSPSEWP